jgi:lipoyltransferase 1
MATVLYKNCLNKTRLCMVLFNRPQNLATGLSATGSNSHYSTERKSSKEIKCIKDTDIRKSVFISQSYDIFTNLALEDWIYRNYDFTNHHILMLWANDPCIVVGRHQNPFAETNVSNLQRKGIALARRNSGGGTVFHDRGNLNCSFFTPRERYDRKYNLNLVTRALYREWGISAELNDRDDITLGGKKVSKLKLFAMKFSIGMLFFNFVVIVVLKQTTIST